MRNKLFRLIAIACLFAPYVNAEETDGGVQEVIVHQVEKQIIPMPTCQDEKLISATKEFISEFYKDDTNKNVKERRHRYFLTHNLDKFSKENIANYKTEDTKPVSDIIADRKINKSIAEENMLLCKNQSANEEAGKLFLLIYPEADGYRVEAINLELKPSGKDTSFLYK